MTTSNLATEEKLQALWFAMLETFTARVADAKNGGEPLSAAVLDVMRKWIADQGITIRTMAEAQTALQQLETLSQAFKPLHSD